MLAPVRGTSVPNDGSAAGSSAAFHAECRSSSVCAHDLRQVLEKEPHCRISVRPSVGRTCKAISWPPPPQASEEQKVRTPINGKRKRPRLIGSHGRQGEARQPGKQLDGGAWIEKQPLAPRMLRCGWQRVLRALRCLSGPWRRQSFRGPFLLT